MNKKYSLKRTCTMVLAGYVFLALLFLFLSQEHIKYTGEEACTIAESPEKDLGELVDGMEVLQTFGNSRRYINGVEGYFLTYGREENEGTVRCEILDLSDGTVLASDTVAASQLRNGDWQTFHFGERIDTETVSGGIGIRFVFEEGSFGHAVTMTAQTISEDGEGLSVNGMDQQGWALCVRVLQMDNSDYAVYYPVVLGGIFVLLLILCVWNIQAEKKGKQTLGTRFLDMAAKYEFLLNQLVSRDFKTKYKRSILGVFWSFLNPLLTMAVQYMVFSRIFRFDVPAYPVYLLTGVVLFNFFTESTTQAMSAITGNAALITKVYVPKYIYPVSKVLSTSINLLFSLIPLFLVALFGGGKFSMSYLMIPFGLLCFLVFVVGLSFFLSTAMVFFRDMQFLWGVFTMLWMYATPIIYPISLIEDTILGPLQKINPLYYYITFFRTIIVEGGSPDPMLYLMCIGFALLALSVGGWTFHKAQDQFILHI